MPNMHKNENILKGGLPKIFRSNSLFCQTILTKGFCLGNLPGNVNSFPVVIKSPPSFILFCDDHTIGHGGYRRWIQMQYTCQNVNVGKSAPLRIHFHFFAAGLLYFSLVVFEYEHTRKYVVLHSHTRADNYELIMFFYTLINIFVCLFAFYFISFNFSLVHSLIFKTMLR